MRETFTFTTPLTLTNGTTYGRDGGRAEFGNLRCQGGHVRHPGTWSLRAGTGWGWSARTTYHRHCSDRGHDPSDSSNLTDGATTTNRLTGGTGTFIPGEISETGSLTGVAITPNNYTELLFTVQLTAAALANADALSFRLLRDGVAI
jgi:hypothetical protein